MAVLGDPPETVECALATLVEDGLVCRGGLELVASPAAVRFERVWRVSADPPSRTRRRRPADAGQRALAERAGLHPAEVELLERGVGDPRLSTILALARALGIEPAELLEGIR